MKGQGGSNQNVAGEMPTAWLIRIRTQVSFIFTRKWPVRPETVRPWAANEGEPEKFEIFLAEYRKLKAKRKRSSIAKP